MAYTMDTTLEQLLKDPKVRPILDQYLPGVADNPLIGMAKGFTLNQIVSMPQAAQLGITKDKVEAFLAEVNKVV